LILWFHPDLQIADYQSLITNHQLPIKTQNEKSQMICLILSPAISNDGFNKSTL